MNMEGLLYLALVLESAIMSTGYSVNSPYMDYGMITFPDSAEDEKLCPPLIMDHGTVECMFIETVVSCASHMNPKTTATAWCNHNYTSDDSDISKLTCLNNGTWDRTLLTCHPESVVMSSESSVNSQFQDYGMITFPDLAEEEKLCPPLIMDHGKVKCTLLGTNVSCASHMKPKTTATVWCNLNYKVEDSDISTLSCLNNGTWDNTLPTCHPVCGFSQQDTLFEPRIIDGLVSHVGLFPWHAGVYHLDIKTNVWEQQCGGSLITDQFVLTAAHCVDGKKEEDVAVALGKHYRSWNRIEPTEQKRNVSKIYYSDNYSSATYVFDIALVLLDNKIKFGYNIMPVCHGFVGGYSNIKDKLLFVVGWGKTENDEPSEELLYRNVSIMDPIECKKKIPLSNPHFEKVCLANNDSVIAVTQKGDSGGGLTIVQNELHYILGIISIKTKTLSMLTDVSHDFDQRWIENTIRRHDAQFSWGRNRGTTTSMCGTSSGDLEVQQINDEGLDAKIGFFPWHAGVYKKREYNNDVSWHYFCGGTVISKRFILTDAKPFANILVAEYQVTLGKYHRSWDRVEPTEQRRYVVDIIVPYEAFFNSSMFDISLLLLDKEINFGNNIMPVCHGFVGDYSNLNDKPLYAAGWGKMKNGERSETLRYKSVSAIDPNVCGIIIYDTSPVFYQLCIARNNSDMDVGPLGYEGGAVTVVVNGKHFLLGIMKEVEVNGSQYATDVSFHEMWIQKHIAEYEAAFSWN